MNMFTQRPRTQSQQEFQLLKIRKKSSIQLKPLNKPIKKEPHITTKHKNSKNSMFKSGNINKSIESNGSMVQNQKNRVSYSINEVQIQVRHEPQRGITKFDRQKVRGLRNMGNTCYINSALQCLHKTQLLYNYLKAPSNKSDVIQSYIHMCQKLDQSTNEPFTPKKIKQLIAQQNEIFLGNAQNDSAEFLNYLLNKLHEDSNLVQNPVIIKLPTNSNTLNDDELCDLYIQKDSKRQTSIINEIFSGRYKTSYVCQECSNTLRLFQRFNIVYLPIPEIKRSEKVITISQCLEQFEKDENLDEWPCKSSICGGKQTKTVKKLQIYRKNKILALCLKRFDQNLKKMNTIIKIQGQIFNEKDEKYELYGMVNHVGSVNSGHYFAYCYNQTYQQWLQYNDSTVSPMQSPQNKESSSAYILFYRQISSTSASRNSHT